MVHSKSERWLNCSLPRQPPYQTDTAALIHAKIKSRLVVPLRDHGR